MSSTLDLYPASDNSISDPSGDGWTKTTNMGFTSYAQCIRKTGSTYTGAVPSDTNNLIAINPGDFSTNFDAVFNLDTTSAIGSGVVTQITIAISLQNTSGTDPVVFYTPVGGSPSSALSDPSDTTSFGAYHWAVATWTGLSLTQSQVSGMLLTIRLTSGKDLAEINAAMVELTYSSGSTVSAAAASSSTSAPSATASALRNVSDSASSSSVPAGTVSAAGKVAGGIAASSVASVSPQAAWAGAGGISVSSILGGTVGDLWNAEASSASSSTAETTASIQISDAGMFSSSDTDSATPSVLWGAIAPMSSTASLSATPSLLRVAPSTLIATCVLGASGSVDAESFGTIGSHATFAGTVAVINVQAVAASESASILQTTPSRDCSGTASAASNSALSGSGGGPRSAVGTFVSTFLLTGAPQILLQPGAGLTSLTTLLGAEHGLTSTAGAAQSSSLLTGTCHALRLESASASTTSTLAGSGTEKRFASGGAAASSAISAIALSTHDVPASAASVSTSALAGAPIEATLLFGIGSFHATTSLSGTQTRTFGVTSFRVESISVLSGVGARLTEGSAAIVATSSFAGRWRATRSTVAGTTAISVLTTETPRSVRSTGATSLSTALLSGTVQSLVGIADGLLCTSLLAVAGSASKRTVGAWLSESALSATPAASPPPLVSNGTTLSVSTLIATAHVTRGVSGNVVASSSIVSGAGATWALSGTIACQATLAAAVRTAKEVTSGIFTSSALAVAASQRRVGAADIEAESGISATPRVRRGCAASINSLSLVSGALRVSRGASGALRSNGTLQYGPTVTFGVSGLIQSTSVLIGESGRLDRYVIAALLSVTDLSAVPPPAAIDGTWLAPQRLTAWEPDERCAAWFPAVHSHSWCRAGPVPTVAK